MNLNLVKFIKEFDISLWVGIIEELEFKKLDFSTIKDVIESRGFDSASNTKEIEKSYLRMSNRKELMQ